MTDNDWWALAFTGPLLIGAALICARTAWHHATEWAARRIELHLAAALERPLPTRYRDLDDEYRALVLAEHDKDN